MENEWIATVQQNSGSSKSLYVIINKKQISDRLKIEKGDIVKVKLLDLQKSVKQKGDNHE